MFGIHSGFSRLFQGPMIALTLITLFSLVLMAVSLLGIQGVDKPFDFGPHFFARGRHEMTGPDYLIMFAIGGVFFGLGVIGSKNTVVWLRRATRVVGDTCPLPVRVTFHTELDSPKSFPKLFATLHPDDREPWVPVITNIPLMTGIQSSRSRYPMYQDTPAQTYFDYHPDGPIVLIINGEYWCSNPGFTHPMKRT